MKATRSPSPAKDPPHRPRVHAAPRGRRPRSRFAQETASILVLALILIAVLSTLAATTLLVATNRYAAAAQTSSWQEAIHGAEGGVDLAMAAMNSGDWSAWSNVAGSNSAPPRVAPTGATTTPAGPPNGPGGGYHFRSLSLSHGGETNQRLAIFVTVDAPASLSNGPGGQWMRIRASGTTDLSGPITLSLSAADRALRRLAFVRERDAGTLLSKPQTSRFVEAVAKPAMKGFAITLKGALVIGSPSAVIDSFDSSDPTKSSSLLYSARLSQGHGDVAMVNSASSDLGHAKVAGDVYYNPTPPINTNQVSGALHAGFTHTFAPVTAPPASWKPTDTSVTIIQSTMTLMAGTKGSPARYHVSQISMNTGLVLTIDPPPGGGESYIEIWCDGNLATTGTGLIVQSPGVHSTFFLGGNMVVTGGSIVNKTNVAANLVINGIDRPPATPGKINVSGAGTFIGVINAPTYNFTLNGAGDFSGALIGNTMAINSTAGLHYDEALNKLGSNYTVASWYEDAR